LEIVIIDFFAQACDEWTKEEADLRICRTMQWAVTYGFDRVSINVPKPNVWQGPRRLTKVNWWAVSNARNSALCLAKGDYVVFCDDRGVLMPGWLQSVREAAAAPYIVAGGYKKVADLEVENGLVVKHGEVLGVDVRTQGNPATQPEPCGGEWCFGCGSGVPLEWALSINGYDEDADGMGFEDVLFGIMLQSNHYPIKFDPQMVFMEERKSKTTTLGPAFKRSDYGITPYDKSHAILNMTMGGRNRAPNYFGPDGIVGLRARIQAGEPFPISQIPDREWFTGTPLGELDDLERKYPKKVEFNHTPPA